MAHEKQLVIIREGAEAWNKWRDDNPYEKIDLRNAKLEYANLRRADLGKADLRMTNLSKTDLREANLYNANLRETDLSRTDLRAADLGHTYLCKTNLSGADLRNADLGCANLREKDLSGMDLRGADLSGANLKKANLKRTNLKGAKLIGANLSSVDFREANISGTNLCEAKRNNWNISGIKCDYVYFDLKYKKRIPTDRDFNPNEFEKREKQEKRDDYISFLAFTTIFIIIAIIIVFFSYKEDRDEWEFKETFTPYLNNFLQLSNSFEKQNANSMHVGKVVIISVNRKEYLYNYPSKYKRLRPDSLEQVESIVFIEESDDYVTYDIGAIGYISYYDTKFKECCRTPVTFMIKKRIVKIINRKSGNLITTSTLKQKLPYKILSAYQLHKDVNLFLFKGRTGDKAQDISAVLDPKTCTFHLEKYNNYLDDIWGLINSVSRIY